MTENDAHAWWGKKSSALCAVSHFTVPVGPHAQLLTTVIYERYTFSRE